MFAERLESSMNSTPSEVSNELVTAIQEARVLNGPPTSPHSCNYCEHLIQMPEVHTRVSVKGSHVKTRTKPPHWGTKFSLHTPFISPDGEKIRHRPQQQPGSPSTDICFMDLMGNSIYTSGRTKYGGSQSFG